MTNEEMNQKMEFIVEQQAQFAADIQATREVQTADTKLFKDALLGVIDIIGRLTRAQERTEGTVDSLAADIKLLTEAQSRTDERLNNLISVVERHIGGNGGSHSHA